MTRHSRGGDGGKGGSIGLGNGGGSSSDHGGGGVSVGDVVVGYGGVSVSGVSIQVGCSSHDGLGLFSEANCQNGGENELKCNFFTRLVRAK